MSRVPLPRVFNHPAGSSQSDCRSNHHPIGLTVRAGWLLDGSGGPVQKDICIHLAGDRIVAVHQNDPDTLSPTQPDVDLSGMTILPALIDAHVHLAFPGSEDPEIRRAALSGNRQQVEKQIRENLRQHGRCGVLGVRDGGDRDGHVLRMKCQERCPGDAPVDWAAAGWAWHAPGRYGSAIGRAPQHRHLLANTLQNLEIKFDHLKVIQSGMNSLDCFGRQTAPQFSLDQLHAAVALARKHGRPVMVHANGRDPVRLSIEAGCHSIEHGYFMGQDNLQRLSDRGIWWVPTVVPMSRLSQNRSLTPDQRDTALRTRDHQLEQIARSLPMGVRIAVGTDAGSPGVEHGFSLREEIQWLMDAGMNLSSAVRSATLEAAALLGWTQRGAVLPGFRADLIAVGGQPNDLPHSLKRIEEICVSGQWYGRKTQKT
jgi:imidazolonepropionase-like amidohydrolase